MTPPAEVDLDLEVEEYDDDEQDPRLAVEVQIAGKHVEFGTPPACGHKTLNSEVVFALIVDDETSEVVGREVMIKARCGECGCSYRFDVSSARESRTIGDLGLVAVVEPTE